MEFRRVLFRSRIAVELAEVAAGVVVARRLADLRAGQAEPERAHRVGDREADVAEQISRELLQPALLLRVLCRLHFLEHPRMAQDRSLAAHHPSAGHDVGALARVRDRRLLPAVVAQSARRYLYPIYVDHVLPLP